MANEVFPTPAFTRDAKRLIKKFHTLYDSIEALEKSLIENPYMGDSYGKGIYKVRLADESKGKGKSGGFRVLTYVAKETESGVSIFLLTIFDKSEESTIDKNHALKLLKKCGID